jgi:ribonuclease HI
MKDKGLTPCLFHKGMPFFYFSNRLKAYCTHNQANYEALLFGLELLDYMGVKHVNVFGDS